MTLNLLKTQLVNDSISKTEEIIVEDYIWNRISDDALASTLITISVFIIGYFIDYLLKKRSENKNNKEIRSFIHFHLSKITTNYLPTIISKYLEASETTTVDSGVLTTPPKILSNDFQRILKIDSVLLFNCFSEKKNISNIISQVEFIDELLKEVQIYHQNFFTKSDPMREELEIQLYDYFDLLASFLEFEERDNNSSTNSETVNLISRLVFLYYDEIASTRNLQRLYDEIVRVIQHRLVSTDIYKTHSVCKKIVYKGKKISHLFTSIKDITQEYCDQYKAFSEMMSNSKNSLIENINKIKWEIRSE